MQNLRKEEDYRYDEENRRRKIKISNGIIPRASTLEKYGITVAEVNAIRAKANLPPIEMHLFYYTALKTHETLQMEINEQSERTLKEKVRSENIKLTEEVEAYKKKQTELKKDFKDKFVDVDPKDLFSIKQIHNWYLSNLFLIRDGGNKVKPKAVGSMLTQFGIKLEYVGDAPYNIDTKIKEGAKWNGLGYLHHLFTKYDKILPGVYNDISLMFDDMPRFMDLIKNDTKIKIDE